MGLQEMFAGLAGVREQAQRIAYRSMQQMRMQLPPL